MKNIYYLNGFLFVLFLLVLLLTGCEKAQTEIISMKVEMQENPNGVPTSHPRFSWQIKSELQDVMQISYQIQVACTKSDLIKEQNLLWDSGVIDSDLSVLIPYAGEELRSRKSYFWRVKVTTNKGDTMWSKIGHWSMALLYQSEWQALWIGENALSNEGETDKGNTRLAARYLRKPFIAGKRVKRAMLYISGLGSYEVYLNGDKVSDDVFAPTVSWYPGRIYYNVYDVTALAKKGRNLLAVKLGNGRYFGMRDSRREFFGLPRLLAQLELEYVDGTSDIILSDASWRVTSKGPIIANNEFDGEEYDARLEIDGWNKIGFDDSLWQQVDLMSEPGGELTAQPNPNIKVMEEITPIGLTELADGRYILDMGQNMVGWLRMNNLWGKKDQPITFRFAELLNLDSTLYVDNLRSAKVTDLYIPSRDGMFSWEPSFVYHGFRFVEITGLEVKPILQNFTGRVIYDKMETTGSFETNNEIINQIFKNAYWGIRGNYRGMPTDCPQRDERQGWLGDRVTGCFGEAFLFDNALLYSKWLQDIEDSQSSEGSISVVSPRYWSFYNDDVTWPAAFFYGAKMLWHQYGDTAPIFRHYTSMKRYLEHIQQVSMQDYIITKDSYGDWCMPPESPELIHSADPSRKTAGAVLSTTMYYSLLNMMCEFAEATNNREDIPGFLALADKIKQAYNRTYFNADSARYDNNTVTANMLSLQLGLAPRESKEAIFDNIVKKTTNDFGSHVSTGVLGIQHLMRGLTQHGNVDLAYKIATNTSYPSWGYMIEKGATTIWELWNGDTADPAMNSANHVMLLGDLLIWYYEDLAGIKNYPGTVAYKNLIMEPHFPEGLTHVKASYNSVYGEIRSEWRKTDNSFSWEITIPANTSATVRLPLSMNIATPESEGARSIILTDTHIEIELGSGTYFLKGSY